jgi:hypothetical protein
LQTSSITQGIDSEYIPRDDESEAARVANINGVGEVSVFDDMDVRQYALHDFGLDLAEDAVREDFR